MDSRAFRDNFPSLQSRVHLASCSSAPRSTQLDACFAEMLDALGAPRGPWPAFEEQVDRVRSMIAGLLKARPAQVALVPNATTGAYQVASSFDWAARPRIVTTDAEFPSIAHVWLAQRARGAEVVFVEDEGDPAQTAARYRAAIDERTALVSVPAVTYARGTRLPVSEIASAARRAGARLFTDAYQAVGAEPTRADDLGCDYLVGGTMKYLLGLPGLAFLFVRAPDEGARLPELTGWFGRIDPFSFDPYTLDFAPTARRYETGTPGVASIYAANAGLELVEQLDLQAVRTHIIGLVTSAARRLRSQGETVEMAGTIEDQGAHINLMDDRPGELAAHLARAHIVTSPRGPRLRLSFHFFNREDDISSLCEGITEFRRTNRRERRAFR